MTAALAEQRLSCKQGYHKNRQKAIFFPIDRREEYFV